MSSMPDKSPMHLDFMAENAPMLLFAMWGAFSKFVLHIKRNIATATLKDFFYYQCLGLFSAVLALYVCRVLKLDADTTQLSCMVSAFLGASLLWGIERGLSRLIDKYLKKVSDRV